MLRIMTRYVDNEGEKGSMFGALNNTSIDYVMIMMAMKMMI